MTATQKIYRGSSSELLENMTGGKWSLVHANPPWSYGEAAPPRHGHAQGHYGGMPMGEIVDDLDRAYDVAAKDAYLVVWCTWPTIWEFATAWFAAPRRWEHLTGGAWGKKGGQGIGFHMLGASEPLLVFRRGRPRPQARPKAKNLWTSEHGGPYWEEPRSKIHSEKPAAALADLVKMATQPGGHVLDLYAGASASLARQCHLLGRNYAGAEIDLERHSMACRLLDAIARP